MAWLLANSGFVLGGVVVLGTVGGWLETSTNPTAKKVGGVLASACVDLGGVLKAVLGFVAVNPKAAP